MFQGAGHTVSCRCRRYQPPARDRGTDPSSYGCLLDGVHPVTSAGPLPILYSRVSIALRAATVLRTTSAPLDSATQMGNHPSSDREIRPMRHRDAEAGPLHATTQQLSQKVEKPDVTWQAERPEVRPASRQHQMSLTGVASTFRK